MTTRPNPWVTLTALIVGYFMVILDMTIVAVAGPKIMTSLHADVGSLVWVTSAYLLSFAALLLPGGRLGDRFGPKNVYLCGLAVFTVASLGCGLASSIGVLIAARALQGVGAALVAPQTMAVITRTFPADRRSAAMSLWGGVAGLANLLGPLLGGALVDRLGWEWIFFVNVPIGVAGCVLAARHVPVLPTSPHRFDVTGSVLSGVGMVLLVYGIQEGGSRSWDAQVCWAVAAGVGVLAVFLTHQARMKGVPLLPLEIFRDRNFALSSAAVAVAAGAVAALMVPLYFYLEAVRVMPGTRAGSVLAPMAVLAMVFVPVIGKFGDRIHPRAIPVAGFALFAVTLAWFAAHMTPTAELGVFYAGAALAGVANACIWPALAVTATLRLPLDGAGAGAGAYNAVRQFGSVLGSAAISTVLVDRMAAHGVDASVGEGGTAPGAVPVTSRGAFGSALGESLYLPVVFLAVGGVMAVFLVRAAGRSASGTLPAPSTLSGANR
ncbi:DHA2 family efflux MFS transporter permease subunit [Streptomyces sp. NPDC056486]|uniref:DHA2 family efflux MFS transporter permease subunit n=1 Tax=Streptomyces sp. NPDC056486 TaxID=3345835 RepID=UPI003682FE18